MNLLLVLFLGAQLDSQSLFEDYSDLRRIEQAHQWHYEWALQINDYELARQSVDRMAAIRLSIGRLLEGESFDSKLEVARLYFETHADHEIPTIYKQRKWLLPNRTGRPLYQFDDLEVLGEFEFPVEHLCVSDSGRIFADISNYDPLNPIKVVELDLTGGRKAFPRTEAQKKFGKIRTLRTDSRNRLWILEARKKLLGERFILSAYDLDSGDQVFEGFEIPSNSLSRGSYPNDVVIDSKRNFAIISDSSPLPGGGAAGLIVVDLNTRKSRRILHGHYSVQPAPYQIQHNGRDWKVLGIFSPKIGVDGIALDESAGTLYFAAGNQGNLYMIEMNSLENFSEKAVKRLGHTPMTDGIAIDSKGGVLLTDFEHSAIVRWQEDLSKAFGGKLQTLVMDSRLGHLSSVGTLQDGSIIFTGNPLEEILFASRDKIKEMGPYRIYRLKISDI